MEIPEYLISQVRDGNAVIFFGAGASREAQTLAGAKAPTTQTLTAALSARFLGGNLIPTR